MAYAVKLPSGLSEQEQKFCMFYMQNGFNGSQAIVAAGYKTKYPDRQAYALLQKPHIKSFVDKLKQKTETKLECTFEWKVKKLQRLIENYMPDNCVDENGTEKLVPPEYTRVAIEAMKELSKMQGHYAAEKRVNVNLSADVDLQRVLEIMPKYEREY